MQQEWVNIRPGNIQFNFKLTFEELMMISPFKLALRQP